MTSKAKTHIIQLLKEAHANTKAAIDKVGTETVVYPESGWRVRDIIAHYSVWNQELINSIRAYIEGREYTNPSTKEYDEFNAHCVEARKDHHSEAVLEEWETTYDTLLATLEDIPNDKFEGKVMLPWEERQSVPDIMSFMADHEKEHTEDSLNADR